MIYHISPSHEQESADEKIEGKDEFQDGNGGMKSQPGSEEVRTSSFGSPDTGQKFETFFGGREFGGGEW